MFWVEPILTCTKYNPGVRLWLISPITTPLLLSKVYSATTCPNMFKIETLAEASFSSPTTDKVKLVWFGLG